MELKNKLQRVCEDLDLIFLRSRSIVRQQCRVFVNTAWKWSTISGENKARPSNIPSLIQFGCFHVYCFRVTELS